MEYIYSAMLLHSAGKKIDEASITAVLKAAGVSADATRVKALTAALEGVNIEEAMRTSAGFGMAAPAAAPAGAGGRLRAPPAAGAPGEGRLSRHRAR